MSKSPFIKPVLLVVFGFVLLISAIKFMPPFLESIFDTNPNNGNSSTFENLRKSKQGKDNDIAQDVKDQLGNDPDKIDAFKYAWNINRLYPDAAWDYKKTPFLGLVDDFNMDARTVTITITSPNTSPFKDKQITMSTLCDKDNSYIELYDYDYIYNKTHDFFDAVDPGVTVLSYCMNESCTEMGRICKIYAKAWGWEPEFQEPYLEDEIPNE